MGENFDLFGDKQEATSSESPKSQPQTASSQKEAKEKSPHAYRTISEVAADLDVAPHVLRFWETRFTEVKPMKRAGGRRYYRPQDIEVLQYIKKLLYKDGYTIRGVQSFLKKEGKTPSAALSATVEKKASSASAPKDMVQAILAELRDIRSILTT